MHFGTPLQTFQLLFDTGSSWTWVNDASCSTCSGANRFDRSQSSSFKSTNTEYELEYGSGRGTARLGYETVSADLGNERFAVSGHPLLLMKKSLGMWALRADGIVGLAFDTLCDGQITLVENFKSQGIIDNSIFAIYFNDGKGDLSSSISFGTWDTHKYSYGLEFTYIRVYSQSGLWAFVLNSVLFGTEEVLEDGKGQASILDSGTSYLMCPNNHFEVIRKAICSTRICELSVDVIAFPCVESDIALLPVMTFRLDGSDFELLPSFYVEEEQGICRVLLAPGEFWILGAAFLRSYYALFDMESLQIGLALSVNNPEPKSNLLRWVGGVALVLVVVAGVGLYCCLRKPAKSGDLSEPLLRGNT